MQTSVIGFPRIGTLRELKFASEKYFKKEIEAGELLQKAQELRKTHWLTQKNAGITYISSNDFSFYDMVLDTAALLGIVPKRYKELNLSELDTYFAMARGYQGTFGDVKALAMKKWFNTNYHYIVPELEDDTEIKISGDKLWSEYAEAKSLGIETKPVVTGAYTILKLCRCTGNKTAADYVDEIVNAYKDLIEKCEKEQIAWIQFDEPALVQDMEKEDIELFHRLYDAILTAVKDAGPNACPPMVVGVGVGGTFEKCAILAKKALTRPVGEHSAIPYVRELEEEMLTKINQLGIGPGGLGGTTTALAVNINTYATHIAGLPVAVNICCHVNRHVVREV